MRSKVLFSQPCLHFSAIVQFWALPGFQWVPFDIRLSATAGRGIRLYYKKGGIVLPNQEGKGAREGGEGSPRADVRL